jgi:hypothetical protein
MTNAKTTSLIVLVTMVLVSACNLPVEMEADAPLATVMTVGVSAPTEYRTGPGPGYELAGTLNPDQQVEAVARNPEGNYLLIRESGSGIILGWIASESATIAGNPFILPTAAPSSLPSPVASSPSVSGCPSPVGGGPTPVSCPTRVEGAPVVSGCPSPVGGGPTPLSCPTLIEGPAEVSGCPSPVGGGPTPVSCPTLAEGPPVVSGCPSPVGGGPTPVSCPTLVEAPPSGGGKPTPVGGSKSGENPTKVPGPTPLPTTVN